MLAVAAAGVVALALVSQSYLARPTLPRPVGAHDELGAFYWQPPTDALLAPPGQGSAAGRVR
jgi:hypothetical protein